MKKIIAIILAVALLTMGLGASAVLAAPGDWTENPDAAAEVVQVDNTITMGYPLDAVVIDFEGLADNLDVAGYYSASHGVTFVGATTLTKGISLSSLYPPKSGDVVVYDVSPGTGVITITFSTPLYSVGGYFTTKTALTFTAYDALNNVVGTDNSLNVANYTGAGTGVDPNYFLHVEYAGGISKVVIDDGGNTYVLDDLTLVGEGGSQGMAVHGASMELPPADQYLVTFDYDLYTWDSYDDPNNTSPPGGHGYFDSFSVTVAQDMYWNLDLTDPVVSDTDIGSLGWIWGGAAYDDGIIYTASGTATVTMNGDPLNTNYLNVVLDTLTPAQNNGSYPSWGEIEIVEVVPIIDVEIDIKPWSFPNSINPKSGGVVPVGILSTDWLDVTQIDPASIDVVFGPDEVAPRHNINDPLVFADHTEAPWLYSTGVDPIDPADDVYYTLNDDDVVDLALHFRQKDTGLDHTDTVAVLKGTFEIDGWTYSFSASDSVRVLDK